MPEHDWKAEAENLIQPLRRALDQLSGEFTDRLSQAHGRGCRESENAVIKQIIHQIEGYYLGDDFDADRQLRTILATARAAIERSRKDLRCSTGGGFGSCRDQRDDDLCANCEEIARSREEGE